MMKEIKLSTIIDLIKNKDAYGMELLYKNHYKLLFSAAFSITKNEEDSKDVVQNVFYKLSKMSKDKFPQTGELSWLYKVVKNEALNFIKTRKIHDDIDEMKDVPSNFEKLDEIFDMDNYYALIANLNEKQKEVLTLKVLGDLSHKEISKILDKPIGTVQWIYNTSIKKLRISLVALMSLFAIFGVTAVTRLFGIYNAFTYTPPQVQGGEMMGQSQMKFDWYSFGQELIYDKFLMTISLLFLAVFISIFIFLKFSEKIPTKHKR